MKKWDRDCLEHIVGGRCMHTITGDVYRNAVIATEYNLLLGVRQRRVCSLGHQLCIPLYRVLRRTFMVMTDKANGPAES